MNFASILIMYDYCVPVQMVMQMAMEAMQVCVSVQTLFWNVAICDTYKELFYPFYTFRSSVSIIISPCSLYMLKLFTIVDVVVFNRIMF